MAKLERQLGFWQVFCIAAGAMISSGLFVLPGLAFAQAGPGVVLSYAIAAVAMVPAMASQAELATAMPRSGGSYFFIERSMGTLPGLLAGLANWFSIALKSAFALVGMGAFAKFVLGYQPEEQMIRWIAIGFCVVFTVMNLLTVKGVGHSMVTMVAILLACLGVFLAVGLLGGNVRVSRFQGFEDKGWDIVYTAGIVFISYGGLTKVASVAGEVRNPGRNLPAGMLAASITVSLLYVAAVFVTVGVLEPTQLADPATGYVNYHPLTSAAEPVLGKPGQIILSAAAILAFVTTAAGGILSASRSPMAMSHDGLLPAALQRVSRFGTPTVAVALTAGFMITLIAALPIAKLVKVASAMMLMLFVMVNLSVIVMRTSRLQNYRPLFKAPLFPWLQIVGIAVYVFLIIDMGLVPLITTAAFMGGGVLWYVVYVRTRISRESAFVYMVRNIVAREMYRGQLEEELKNIALERDQVTQDRFDRLVQDCEILDLPGPVPAEEMFPKAAEVLAPRLKMSRAVLEERFAEREKESSTVVDPGLAIPHVIVPGKGVFDVLLVRSREGIVFPEADQPVSVAFILVGSADQRNFHLRALMSIAHIAGEPGFQERWTSAADAENLRDLVLLSRRQREK